MSTICQCLARLNRIWIFQPARWPYPEFLGRCAGLLAVVVFLGLKVYQFHRFPQSFDDARQFFSALTTAQGTPLFSFRDIVLIWGVRVLVWLAETGILVGYIIAYLSRVKPVGIAQGFMETLFPIIVAGIPVLMALTPANHLWGLSYASSGYLPVYLGVMGVMALGGWINLAGLLTLRRSFAIMTEARELVSWGIYRYVRHPLYLGHFLMFFAGLLLRWHWYTFVLYLVFIIGQVIRAKLEEAKLARTLEGYLTYRGRTGMFLPRIGGVRPNWVRY